MLLRPQDNRSQKYRNIREAARPLNNKILKIIPKEVINRTAKDMTYIPHLFLELIEFNEICYNPMNTKFPLFCVFCV